MTEQIYDVIIPTYRSVPEIAPLVAEILATAGVPVNVIATCRKASASVNRNCGLDRATSPIVFMLDDDIEALPTDWAKRMIAVMDEHSDGVMCSPRLMRPGGLLGVMMGGIQAADSGVTTAIEHRLPTACVAVRNNGLRFDENFRGSGWEDNDYCLQLRQDRPDGTFLVVHDLHVIHRNEMKEQHGSNWDHNQQYLVAKWDREPKGVAKLPPVWVYWEGPMLPYIGLCLDTIRRHCKGLDLRIVNRASIEEYVRPDELLHNAWRGITHPSIIADALRVCVLKQHGGLWIDADTIMLRSPGPLLDDKPGFMVWNELPPLIPNGYIYLPPKCAVADLWLDQVNARLSADQMGWCELGEKALTAAVQSLPADATRRKLHATAWPLSTWLPVDIRYSVRRFYGTLDFPQDYITPHTVGFGLNHSAFMNDARELVSQPLATIAAGNTLFARVIKMGMTGNG